MDKLTFKISLLIDLVLYFTTFMTHVRLFASFVSLSPNYRPWEGAMHGFGDIHVS